MTKEWIESIKIPAHNYNAEKALLSCIMQDNKILYYLKDFNKTYDIAMAKLWLKLNKKNAI